MTSTLPLFLSLFIRSLRRHRRDSRSHRRGCCQGILRQLRSASFRVSFNLKTRLLRIFGARLFICLILGEFRQIKVQRHGEKEGNDEQNSGEKSRGIVFVHFDAEKVKVNEGEKRDDDVARHVADVSEIKVTILHFV